MSQAQIEEALRAAFLQALPDASGITAFENQVFDPAGKTKWYRFSFLPNNPEGATLGTAGQDLFTGIAQIDINIMAGRGKDDVENDIEALRAVFFTGARLLRAPVNVLIRSCGRNGTGRRVEEFYRFILTIGWECRISKTPIINPLTIEGLPRIGGLLRASGGRGRVQWLRDGQPIPQAGGEYYIVTDDDVWKTISFTDGVETSDGVSVEEAYSLFSFEIDTNGDLILSYPDDSTPPKFTLENGHLFVNMPDGYVPKT